MGSVPGSSATAAGAVLNAVGDVFNGFSQAGQLSAQANIARNNAYLASQNAAYSSASGEARAQGQGLRTRGQLGAVKAGFAGAGLDVNSGSAVDVVKSADRLGMLDALTIRSNAARQAYGYQLQSQEQTLQSKIYSRGATMAPYIGAFNAVSSLVGGAGSLQNMYANWQVQSGQSPSGNPLDSVFGADGPLGSSAGLPTPSTGDADYDALFAE